MPQFFLSPDRHSETPWYDRNLFWGPLALGIGILLVVIAAVKHDLGWLLFFALPWFLLASWAVTRRFSSTLTKCSVMLLIALFLLGTLYRLNAWLRTERGQEEQPRVESNVPQIQISYSMLESLPIFVSPGGDFYILSFHNNKTADASHVTNPETKPYFYPKEEALPDFIGLCRVGNQTDKIDFDISLTFGVHFRNPGKNMPDIAYANREILLAGSLKPGDYARIYFVNQSSFDVQVDLPPAAVLQVQGQTERAIAKVNRLVTNIVDQVPPFLVPSSNKWD